MIKARMMTLGREDFNMYIMKAAKKNRDIKEKLIYSAFEGSDQLAPERFVRLTYLFQEKRAEYGTVIGDELSNSNQCIIIKSGQCLIFKKKNVLKPFKTWKESLDDGVRYFLI